MADPTPEERAEQMRIFREVRLAHAKVRDMDPLSDEALPSTIATRLSYRPGVGCWPANLLQVEETLKALPVESLRYLATGATNLHQWVGEARREAQAEARGKAFEEAAKLCDEQREVEEEHSNPDASDVCVSLAQQIRARAKETPSNDS